MKTKILYVLVSSDKDIYLEMAIVSMASVKHHNPESRIVLIVDKETSNSIHGLRTRIRNYIDEFVEVDLEDDLPPQKRSRLLKTSARKYIQGDFLFIDCDTIIVRPINDIDNISSDISACWDSHTVFKKNPYRYMCLENTKSLGCNFENEHEYFNSGIILVKDTPTAHEFYDRWYSNYCRGYNLGVRMDQPSFAQTNWEMGHIIDRLQDVWNCELKHGIKYLKDCYIVHYLTTNKSKEGDVQLFTLNNEDIMNQIKKNNEIPKIIYDLMENPFVGIANCSYSCAGNEVDFLCSPTYRFIINQFENNSFWYRIMLFSIFMTKKTGNLLKKTKCLKRTIIS